MTLVSISLLMVVTERGVSTAVLPKPNTDSSGSVGITLTRSPSTTTVSSTASSAAPASGAANAASPADSETDRANRPSQQQNVSFDIVPQWNDGTASTNRRVTSRFEARMLSGWSIFFRDRRKSSVKSVIQADQNSIAATARAAAHDRHRTAWHRRLRNSRQRCSHQVASSSAHSLQCRHLVVLAQE